MIVPNLYALTQEHWIRTLVETTQDLTLTADYALEQQIGFKLRLANQRHLEIFNRRMPDITPTQFAVLAKLRDEARISQNHLGRLVGMDAATNATTIGSNMGDLLGGLWNEQLELSGARVDLGGEAGAVENIV